MASSGPRSGGGYVVAGDFDLDVLYPLFVIKDVGGRRDIGKCIQDSGVAKLPVPPP